MLFDFIAFVNTDGQATPYDNPFDELNPYPSLSYHHQDAQSEHAQVISLHKYTEETRSVYRSDDLEVYIFGYCFTRLDSRRFPDRTRLSAQRIADVYQGWGTNFIREIKGSFAILILDKGQQTTHVFTDPLNVRPVYYYQIGSQLVVATSLSALLRHRQSESLPTEPNVPAMIEYYMFEYPLNDDTYIKSVQTVPAGGWLRFSSDGLQTQTYWNAFEQLGNFSIRYNERSSINILEHLLKRNISMYVTDPARTAVALTGGYDSRTNLALLGNQANKYFFYSYGVSGTYDLSIPRRIARRLRLNYQPILLGEDYRSSFSENAELAMGLGDGLAEINRANYPYVFRQLGPQYDAILTGLFGSELIKHPTSVGNFISADTKRLLEDKHPEQYLGQMLTKAAQSGYLSADALRIHEDEIRHRVLSNPYLINDHPLPIKYFYYLLMVGIRKYFMKEIKVERPFVENLHPFLDIEFVETLLQTPFPWVHHWEGKRDLLKSINTHKFYVTIMQRNRPALTRILSTHAYTPYYLLSKFLRPLMALQYPYYRRKIKASGSFQSNAPAWEYLRQHPPSDYDHGLIRTAQLRPDAPNPHNTIKLASLQYWLSRYATPSPKTL